MRGSAGGEGRYWSPRHSTPPSCWRSSSCSNRVELLAVDALLPLEAERLRYEESAAARAARRGRLGRGRAAPLGGGRDRERRRTRGRAARRGDRDGAARRAGGHVAVICVSLLTMKRAVRPLKVTAVAPVKPLPTRVTVLPTGPEVGIRAVMAGTVTSVGVAAEAVARAALELPVATALTVVIASARDRAGRRGRRGWRPSRRRAAGAAQRDRHGVVGAGQREVGLHRLSDRAGRRRRGEVVDAADLPRPKKNTAPWRPPRSRPRSGR